MNQTAGAVLKAALQYFLMVFGAGFALGTVRVLLLAPQVGVRLAELLEMPLMVAVTIIAARRVTKRLENSSALVSLGMGLLSLALLLGAELALVWISGSSLRDYVASRDPISGTAYLVALLLFGFMPWILRR